jgi:hypothetical protein
MQMKNPTKIILFSAILLLTLGLMGCRSAPVYNVEDAAVNVGPAASLKAVKKAIMAAGAGLGWQMRQTEPGVITGTLFLRKHMAKVKIPYSKTNYSILYEDSSELGYDGTNIHNNYNGWVQNLDRAIKARLMILE